MAPNKTSNIQTHETFSATPSGRRRTLLTGGIFHGYSGASYHLGNGRHWKIWVLCTRGQNASYSIIRTSRFHNQLSRFSRIVEQAAESLPQTRGFLKSFTKPDSRLTPSTSHV
jgi:hypothetical protein